MSVLVFAEPVDGKFKKASFEVIQYSSEIALKTNSSTTVIVIGDASADELASLEKFGAKKVIHFTDARLKGFDSGVYTKVIAAAAQLESAQVIIFSNNFSGKALAPRIAARMKAGLVAGASDYPKMDAGFVVRKSVFSGKAFADYEITTAVKVIALNPNSFPVVEGSGTAVVEKINVELSDLDFRVKVLSVEKASGQIPLTSAEIVVSAGRGMKGPENWGMVEELAKELGAATACSRPVSDVGWRPHNEHVGQTGKTIRPNLYIAIGISGAIQHLAGVNGSKVIVVINKDPEAPFFKAADYGILGDAFEVLPKLIEAVKKFKAQH